MTTRRAFTLLEMIVALAVTSVLTVMMLRMFTDTSTIWKREDERLDTFREARAALQLMASELGSVNAIPGVTVAGSPEFPALALRYHNDTPAADQTVPGNQEIYALASLPYRPVIDPATSTVHDKGELRAIGYFCEWRQDMTALNQARNCYVLCRQLADSDTTFSRLQQVLNAGAPTTYPASFNVLYSRQPPSTSSATTTADPVQDLASYIWDLQFTLPPPTPTSATPSWPEGSYGHELPQWIEIRFKALGTNAAHKLAGQNLTRANWFQTKDSTYQNFILPSEQQFVTRVKLNR